MKPYSIGLFVIGLCCLAFGYWLLMPASVQAQEVTVEPTGDDSYCILCHTDSSTAQYMLADGTAIPVNVDASHIDASVHAELGCVDCHGEKAYPHGSLPAANPREYSISASNLCIDCHSEQAENLADDVHYTALVEGNLRAATCTDCHGAHEVQDPTISLTGISETCGECHQIVFNEYRDSVHGAALFDGDTNVPTCVSCHGVHGIQHPTTAQFRNRSPQLCADCHADTELMAEYEISTNVFNSYLNDFHGTTVALFEQTAPDVASNKAVCYDCHGVHNILSPDDENSQVIQTNLLATCRECHPDASSDFPNSWLGHYEPTFESHPILTLVNLFYAILIPLVVGAFIFLVATDIFRMVRQRMGGSR